MDNKIDMGRMSAAFKLLKSSTDRKYLFRWLRSFEKNYFLKRKQPWFSYAAIDFLNTLELKQKLVFEYGSGGSTLYWLKRGAWVTSVEHDPVWYNSLHNKRLDDPALDYRLVLPEHIGPNTLNPADPDSCSSTDALFLEHTFVKYCSQIDEFPDKTFDLVLVDGRARPGCIKHAYQKVKIGGCLILDNSDRGYYLEKTAELLKYFERRIYAGATPGIIWITETSVFTRKS